MVIVITIVIIVIIIVIMIKLMIIIGAIMMNSVTVIARKNSFVRFKHKLTPPRQFLLLKCENSKIRFLMLAFGKKYVYK